MNSLFPEEPIFPEGFLYFPDFLTEHEEAELVAVVSQVALKKFMFQGFEAKRSFASFGQDYSFEQRTLKPGHPIPAAFQPLIQKAQKYFELEKEIAELLVLEYPPGAVINWHRDAPPFETIIGISLLADCTFKLRPHDKKRQTRSAIIQFPVRRRSIYLMQGPSPRRLAT